MTFHLHLLLDAPDNRARMMLDTGRQFGLAYPDRPAGERNSVVYATDSWACAVWWTRARSIVIRELGR